MAAQNLPETAPEPAPPQPIDAQPPSPKNRSHVGRALGTNPLPSAPPEPAPHEPHVLELKTPPVERPAETGGMSKRFALGTDRPD